VNKNKSKKIKINGQAIYSGNMNHFTRNNVVKQIHSHYKPYVSGEKLSISDNTCLKVVMEFHLPINYGDLRWNNKLGKPVVVNKAVPTPWDLDNLWIYNKCFQDTCVEEGFIPKDDVSLIQSVESRIIFVESMEQSKIVVGFEEWID
jgi:hypothetical protein